LDPLEYLDVEMGKKGSGVGDKKHGMKCRHPEYYKNTLAPVD
jgi:hypothetical protein